MRLRCSSKAALRAAGACSNIFWSHDLNTSGDESHQISRLGWTLISRSRTLSRMTTPFQLPCISLAAPIAAVGALANVRFPNDIILRGLESVPKAKRRDRELPPAPVEGSS